MSRVRLCFPLLCILTAISASAQPGTNRPTQVSTGLASSMTPSGSSPTNPISSVVQHAEQLRADCIRGRRLICGKILKVLPEGLIVESGYTNLLREPLTKSWLVPGSVTASLATNLLEGGEPGTICIGPAFLTDLPKSRGHKPKQYDYVILEGYPAGKFTYNSLGTIQKTVRRFSAKLNKAVELHLEAEQATPPTAAAAQ